MSEMRFWISALCVAGMLLAGCVRQAPQIPSRKMGTAPKVDSTALALMEMNQRMAVAADKLLAQRVQQLSEPYALYEHNTWWYVIDRGDVTGAKPQPNEEWTVHMRVMNLDGKLLEDTERSYRIGKGELPPGVDDNISELYKGGKARLLVPWYAAFGLQGTACIPPYENVMIEIELK